MTAPNPNSLPQAEMPPDPPEMDPIAAAEGATLYMDWPAAMSDWSDYNDWMALAQYEQPLLIFSGFNAWTLNSSTDQVTIPNDCTIISPLSGGRIVIEATTLSGVDSGDKLYLQNVEFPLSSGTKTVTVGSLSNTSSRRPDCIFLGVRVSNTLYMRASSVPAAEPALKSFDARLASNQSLGKSTVINFTPTLTDSDAYTYSTSNDDLEILEDGRYQVSFSVTGDISSPTAAGQFSAHLELDSGSGFSNVDGSQVFGYLSTAFPYATGSSTRVLSLSSGDKLRVVGTDAGSVQSIRARSDGTTFAVIRVG